MTANPDSTIQANVVRNSIFPGGAMIRRSKECPKLLVSVRSRMEADRALAGGADILDVKEPSSGSLGMAAINEIAAIAVAAKVVTGAVPLSVALGEVVDWSSASHFPVLPSGIAFAKLGLSHCLDIPDWRSEWLRVRIAFEHASMSKPGWVAVAYADSREAVAPGIPEVLDAAIETGCSGLLIDTWTKDGRTLLDELNVGDLMEAANRCHSAGIFIALAGRLDRDSLPVLSAVPVDIIAIRSAACTGSDRTAELDANLVHEFQREMQHQADSASPICVWHVIRS